MNKVRHPMGMTFAILAFIILVGVLGALWGADSRTVDDRARHWWPGSPRVR